MAIGWADNGSRHRARRPADNALGGHPVMHRSGAARRPGFRGGVLPHPLAVTTGRFLRQGWVSGLMREDTHIVRRRLCRIAHPCG